VPVVVFASLLSMLPAIVWSLLIAKQSWSIVTAVCLSIPLRAVLRIVAEGLRGFHDLKTASAFATQNAGQAAGPVIDLMFLIVLFAMRGATDLSLTVVLWANVAAIAVCLPLPLWALRMRVAALPGDAIGLPSPSLGPLPTRRFIIYDSLAVLISQVCSFAAWYADNFIAKFVLSPDDFGLYTSARYLITTVILPLSLMNMSVISLIPEMMTRGEKSQLEKVLRTSSFVASLPSIIAIILMCFFANLVMSVAFSSSYAAGGPVLAIMALGRLVNAVTATASFVLMMTGNEKIQIILCILATLAMCVAGPIAAWAGGLIAYAVSIAVVFSLFCASLELAVRRSTGIWTHAQIPAFLKRRTA
ncbi:MAG: hypothetical protein KDA99_08215, partial [Planctomycetales bacterium]|nr:hypothetical protein [Planctomycetales bacterium]